MPIEMTTCCICNERVTKKSTLQCTIKRGPLVGTISRACRTHEGVQEESDERMNQDRKVRLVQQRARMSPRELDAQRRKEIDATDLLFAALRIMTQSKE